MSLLLDTSNSFVYCSVFRLKSSKEVLTSYKQAALLFLLASPVSARVRSMEVSTVSRVNCIPHYPGLTAIQFDRETDAIELTSPRLSLATNWVYWPLIGYKSLLCIFCRGVLNEIRDNGYLVEYLYMENCSLRYLPYYVFDFLPNLKWLDLRLIYKKYTIHKNTL